MSTEDAKRQDELPEPFRADHFVLVDHTNVESIGENLLSNPQVLRGWQVRSIKDICLRVTSGGTPSRRKPSFYENGSWSWVKTQELHDGWLYDTEEHITESAIASSSAKILPEKTLLIALYGATVGQLGILRRPMTCNQACGALIVNPKEADYRYLFYQLLHDRPRIKNLATGAAQQNISGALVKSLQFSFPPLPEQRAIAHILGTLDDKIELNRRMNETLEGMARALFKSWFVDFDPVRAKMEGQDTGLPPDVADLFPDRLVESELGEIPEGWEIGCFGDIVEQVRDKENPFASPDTTFHHFSIPAFDKDQWPQTERGEDIKSQKSRVPPGAILLSKLNPEIERVWLVDVAPDERAICSTEFLVLQARPPFQRSYVYCLARSPLFRQQVESLVTGTSKSHQRAQAGAVLALEATIPSAPVIRAFDQQASALLDRSVRCRGETTSLAALRDTLLPKLVSGEVRVNMRD